jgi:hypothetical protein
MSYICIYHLVTICIIDFLGEKICNSQIDEDSILTNKEMLMFNMEILIQELDKWRVFWTKKGEEDSI